MKLWSEAINKFNHIFGAPLQQCCTRCLICCKEVRQSNSQPVSQPGLGHTHLVSCIDSPSEKVIYRRGARACRTVQYLQSAMSCKSSRTSLAVSLLINGELAGSQCETWPSGLHSREKKRGGKRVAQFHTSSFEISVILDLRGASRKKKRKPAARNQLTLRGGIRQEVLLHPQTQLETFPRDRVRLSLARLPHIW